MEYRKSLSIGIVVALVSHRITLDNVWDAHYGHYSRCYNGTKPISRTHIPAIMNFHREHEGIFGFGWKPTFGHSTDWLHLIANYIRAYQSYEKNMWTKYGVVIIYYNLQLHGTLRQVLSFAGLSCIRWSSFSEFTLAVCKSGHTIETRKHRYHRIRACSKRDHAPIKFYCCTAIDCVILYIFHLRSQSQLARARAVD